MNAYEAEYLEPGIPGTGKSVPELEAGVAALAAAGGSLSSRMLKCATVSVKDSHDDTEFAKLRAVVAEDFPLLHEKAEHQLLAEDCWMYKLPGKDTSRNILLMSHHDVVPADDDWTMPAFDGIIKDGKVYGRGAADTKGSLCAILFAVEEMLRDGIETCEKIRILREEGRAGEKLEKALSGIDYRHSQTQDDDSLSATVAEVLSAVDAASR